MVVLGVAKNGACDSQCLLVIPSDDFLFEWTAAGGDAFDTPHFLLFSASLLVKKMCVEECGWLDGALTCLPRKRKDKQRSNASGTSKKNKSFFF